MTYFPWRELRIYIFYRFKKSILYYFILVLSKAVYMELGVEYRVTCLNKPTMASTNEWYVSIFCIVLARNNIKIVLNCFAKIMISFMSKLLSKTDNLNN